MHVVLDLERFLLARKLFTFKKRYRASLTAPPQLKKSCKKTYPSKKNVNHCCINFLEYSIFLVSSNTNRSIYSTLKFVFFNLRSTRQLLTVVLKVHL